MDGTKLQFDPLDLETVSSHSINYLTQIIEHCQANGKRVILIRSPLHDKYAWYKNELTFKAVLANNFENIEFLDFSKFPLKNSEFADFEHLNSKGATVYSTWFGSLLRNNILEKEDKQSIINDAIQLRTSEFVTLNSAWSETHVFSKTTIRKRLVYLISFTEDYLSTNLFEFVLKKQIILCFQHQQDARSLCET